MSDAINPDHYKRLPAEAIEIIEAMIEGAPDNKAAYLHGQAAKYDLRLWEKGKSLEDYLADLGKHIWYALRLESHLLGLIEKQKANEQQKAADLQSFKDHPFGKLKKAHLNSDKIPEGYRKLNDSSEEPRQLGDLRWSVSQKRYVEITVDEIGYANRDNWAACRKVETVIKQPLNTEPPDGWRPNDNVALAMQMATSRFGRKVGVFNAANFSNAMRQLAGVTCNLDGHVVASILKGRSDVEVLKGGSHYRYLFYKSINSSQKPAEPPKPTAEVAVEVTGEVTGEVKHPLGCPDGWRWLEIGEVIRKGDVDRSMEPVTNWWIGEACGHNHDLLRRNRFEVGEKVVYIPDQSVWTYVSEINDGPNHPKSAHIASGSTSLRACVTRLAPYFEDAK